MRRSVIRAAEAASEAVLTPMLRSSMKVDRFPFPKRSVLVSAQKGSKVKLQVPIFPDAGMVETSGHRTRVGRWVRGRKVLGRARQHPQMKTYGWTHPFDRVKQWYVWKGDKVRITTGPAKLKFNDPERGVSSGYKIYTVLDVSMDKNRVFLVEHTRVRSKKEPDDFQSWPQAEQRKWQLRNSLPPTNPSIQLSNISLLVEEAADPADHVWSRRIQTTPPVWDKLRQEWTWDRYATAVTGPSQRSNDFFEEEPEPVTEEQSTETEDQTAKAASEDNTKSKSKSKKAKRSVTEIPSHWRRIEWPKGQVKDLLQSSIEYEQRTDDYVIASERISPVSISELKEVPNVVKIVPRTENAKLPNDQSISDSYLLGSTQATAADHLMPLYLSEELSPRFTTHKMAELYKLRQSQAKEAKETFVKAALQKWHNQGRDRNLRRVMDAPDVGLAGVPLSKRSARDIREAATIEWEDTNAKHLAEVAGKLKRGWRWNHENPNGGWIRGPKAQRTADKRVKKLQKATMLRERLAKLKLGPGANMVVPPQIAKPPVVRPDGQTRTKKSKKAKSPVRMDDLEKKYLRRR